MLENKIENVEADYGYGKVFAMHLQSDKNPVCPIGTFQLWIGYSLVKAFVSFFCRVTLLRSLTIQPINPYPHATTLGPENIADLSININYILISLQWFLIVEFCLSFPVRIYMIEMS